VLCLIWRCLSYVVFQYAWSYHATHNWKEGS
jgi:hypothetical protein